MSTLKKLLGLVCLLFGLFALVTPFTPGSWLAFVGLELLGLSFLLPHPVRTRWEGFKAGLLRKWRDWNWGRKRDADQRAAARATTPRPGGGGA